MLRSNIENETAHVAKFVVSFQKLIERRFDEATSERPHFFITYGTKSPEGLKVFRQIEYDALRQHEKNRANAKERIREERTSTMDMFAGHQASVQEATIDEIIQRQMRLATADLLEMIATQGPLPFSNVLVALLQPYMLRETNVKDICVNLAKAGKIENTWGDGRRKPNDVSPIQIKNFPRQ